MQYTDQQLQQFREEFAKRRRRQFVVAIPAVAVFVVLASAERGGGKTLLGPAAVVVPMAIALIVGILAFSLTNWRCPACRKYLGKAISPRFCTSCGVQLQE
jgi:hypothetical protein